MNIIDLSTSYQILYGDVYFPKPLVHVKVLLNPTIVSVCTLSYLYRHFSWKYIVKYSKMATFVPFSFTSHRKIIQLYPFPLKAKWWNRTSRAKTGKINVAESIREKPGQDTKRQLYRIGSYIELSNTFAFRSNSIQIQYNPSTWQSR